MAGTGGIESGPAVLAGLAFAGFGTALLLWTARCTLQRRPVAAGARPLPAAAVALLAGVLTLGGGVLLLSG